MVSSTDILSERRAQLTTELEFQRGQEERLTAAIADLPGIISDLESAIAELDTAIQKINA